MKKVILTSAPYSYGPTSKIISIATELKDKLSFFYVGMEPGLSLVQKCDFIQTIEITHRNEWNIKAVEQLKKSELLITGLDYRCLKISNEYKVKSVFVDTLFWLRDEMPPYSNLASVYLIQKFFKADFIEQLEMPHNGQLIETILPFNLIHSKIRNQKHDILVNFGGLKSPMCLPDSDLNYILLVSNILNQSEVFSSLKSKICLPSYLIQNKEYFENIFPISQIEFPSIELFADLLSNSNILLTSPGLETVLEGLFTNTEIFFLLPYNGTQLFQSIIYQKEFNSYKSLWCQEYEKIFYETQNKKLEIVTKRIQNFNQSITINEKSITNFSRALDKYLNEKLTILHSNNRSNHSLQLKKIGTKGREQAAKIIMNLLK